MRITAAILLSLGLYAGQAGASLPVPLPAAVLADARQVAGELRPLGSGEMRWFGFKIYDAALWVPAGVGWSTETVFALAIRYAREIEGERLVEATLDEMRRMGLADEARIARWREPLTRALPSVAVGDTLVGLSVPDGGARFWHDGKSTAILEDSDLARAFFAIWLDSQTREPALRLKLLGLEQVSR